VTREKKERLSFILFAVPNEDTIIKVPAELVDEEGHPLRYRSFTYEEFLHFHASTRRANATLERFVGV